MFIRSQILIIIFIIIETSVFAQRLEDNPVVRDYLDEMFEDIDKSRIPTGYLREFAFDLVDFDTYDGVELTDSNYVTPTVIEMILRSIRSAAVGTKPFENVVNELNELNVETNEIPVAIVLYEYNYIVENACEDGLIVFEDERAHDAYTSDGIWLNPYAKSQIFGFSPLNEISYTSPVVYYFNGLYTNTSISKIEFDSGVGSGYKTISINEKVSVNYENGEYELKMRITLASGEVLVSHSSLSVHESDLVIPTKGTGIYGDKPDTCTIKYNGKPKAVVSYMYKIGKSSITKPFIIVEGFDLLERIDDYSSGSSNFNYNNIPYDLASNYDFVYVDWLDATSDLKENAAVLVEVIEYINELKHKSGSDEKNILLGQSMGGVVARITLREMELSGQLHETSVYVSQDAPHLGANIPIGVLYLLYDFLSFWKDETEPYTNWGFGIGDTITNINDSLKKLYSLLNSTAVKQLLVNYVDSEYNVNNYIYEEFQNYLDSIGFPQGDEDSKILNMSICHSGSAFLNYTTNDHLLYYNDTILKGFYAYIMYQFLGKEYLKIFRGLGWRCRLNALLDIRPFVFPGCKVSEFSINYTKTKLFGGTKEFEIASNIHNAPNFGPSYDVLPASVFNVGSLEDSIRVKIENSQMSNIVNLETLQIADYFAFIPTASAVCLNNGDALVASDYSKDFYHDIPNYPNETPFTFIKMTDVLDVHAFGGSRVSSDVHWVVSQLGVSISGPLAPQNGDVYTLVGTDNIPSWQTSNANVATIDSNGKITVNSSGFIDIIAKINHSGLYQFISKRVMVGFPSYSLSTMKVPSVLGSATHHIFANPIDDEILDFDTPLNIKYHWGVQYSGSDIITWEEGSTDYNSFTFSFGGSTHTLMATIYFYVSSSFGESPRYSVNITNENYGGGGGGITPILPPIIVHSDGVAMSTSTGDVSPSINTKSLTETYYIHVKNENITRMTSELSSSTILELLLSDDKFISFLKEIRQTNKPQVIPLEILDQSFAKVSEVPLIVICK